MNEERQRRNGKTPKDKLIDNKLHESGKENISNINSENWKETIIIQQIRGEKTH